MSSIAKLLFAIKRPYSYRAKQYLRENDPALLSTLTVRERPGKAAFRFWQEGAGYDRNLVSSETVHSAIDYIHMNPVKRGLCQRPEEWKWSSWKTYHVNHEDRGLPRVERFVE